MLLLLGSKIQYYLLSYSALHNSTCHDWDGALLFILSKSPRIGYTDRGVALYLLVRFARPILPNFRVTEIHHLMKHGAHQSRP